MLNNERQIVKILKEICGDIEAEYNSFSQNWVQAVTKNNRTVYIIGYILGLNKSSVGGICTDKCAASEVLNFHNIPCVRNDFFISPSNQKYIGENGNYERLFKLIDKHKKLVCKPNEGSGGENVMVCENYRELEFAADKIFTKSRGMAVSKFINIKNEYRLVMLNGECVLCFEKERPFCVGDGDKTVSELTAGLYKLNLSPELLQSIPKKGEKVICSFKHNLASGAVPRVIVPNEGMLAIAKKACKCLDIRFASVDIIFHNGNYEILEINNGVMLEKFSAFSLENYEKAKNVYKKAVLSALAE